MKRREVAPLRARWNSAEGRDLARAAARWLALGGSLPEGIGTHDGRVDLRGMRFPPAFYLGAPGGKQFYGDTGKYRRPRWVDVDLSGAVMWEGRLIGLSVENCRFDFADFTGLHLWATRVVDSSFVGATLVDGALGTGISPDGGRNEFVGVDFDRADLRRSHFTRALLSGCTLRGSKLGRVHFDRAEFTDVVIEAFLDHVWINGLYDSEEGYAPPPMRRVDFTGSTARGIYFEGYQLLEVHLPDGAFHIRNVPKTNARAIEILLREPDPHLSVYADRFASMSARNPGRCFDSVIFPHDSGELSDRLVTLYGRAMEELGDELDCVDSHPPISMAARLSSIIRGRWQSPPRERD